MTWSWPLAASWLSFALLHLAHVLHLREGVSLAWVSLMMLPLLAWELTLCRWMKPKAEPSRTFIATTLFWLIAFGVWVMAMGWAAESAPFLRWFGPEFYFQIWLVIRAQGWLTLAALTIWAALYITQTAQRRRLRLGTSLVTPAALIILLFAHLTFLGGVGADSLSQVISQEGVSHVFDPRTLHIDGAPRPAEAIGEPIECIRDTPQADRERVEPYRWHPRDVFALEDALLLSYGCSWCPETDLPPSVLRVSLTDERVQCFQAGNLHHIDHRSADGSLIWAAPWSAKYIYGLRANDLSIASRIKRPKRSLMPFFQPIQVIEDLDGSRVYAGTELEATLVSMQRAQGGEVRLLRLPETGRVRWGGPLHFLAQHPETRRLYFTSGPGDNLFEVDPDTMALTRSKSLGDVVGTALVLDATNNRIYYQCGVKDALYAVSLDTFEVERVYEGEIHARRLALDLERRRLYVLGHFSGSVFALDLDSGERLWTREVGGRPHGLDLAEDILWVNSFLGVFALDLNTITPTS